MKLNLEIRCLKENRIPVFHFSELLSLALEGKFSRAWLKRHLIDPVPLLEEKQLINDLVPAKNQMQSLCIVHFSMSIKDDP
ncbi:MAG: hypothetical protein U5K27_19390 [Desulfotignum sp.]|nr:hypothetical protein [Desulfotignum sp.]